MSAGRKRSWSILTTMLLFSASLYVLMLLLTASCPALKHNTLTKNVKKNVVRVWYNNLYSPQ